MGVSYLNPFPFLSDSPMTFLLVFFLGVDVRQPRGPLTPPTTEPRLPLRHNNNEVKIRYRLSEEIRIYRSKDIFLDATVKMMDTIVAASAFYQPQELNTKRWKEWQ